MSPVEPILSDDDITLWNAWRKTFAVHATTSGFRRRVDSAKKLIASLEPGLKKCVMWSAGKDSTAMLHLICVEMGIKTPVVSEKDDLDYPGEHEYTKRLAEQWGLDLEIITPKLSPLAYLRGADLEADCDVHSRKSGLSKACFYNLVEESNKRFDLIFLGIRAAESAHRKALREFRSRLYTIKNGETKCIPIADWTGLDVYAYIESRGIEIMPVYKCIGLMHREEPWRIRKSWWLPGSHGRHGGVAWLRRYYPSLWQTHCELFRNTDLIS